MKKSTLTAQASSSVVALALLSSMTQANPALFSDVSALELDMVDAAMAAAAAIDGDIIEAELETDAKKAIWEIDIVNEKNKLITVEIDARTGQILSTENDDNTELDPTSALSLAKAIDAVKAIENGALVEAELENEHGKLIWEVETLGKNDQESKFRINAETGEILI